MAKLYIICGHGAGDPGASGGGYNEAERVRALAAEMARQGGSKVSVLDTSKNWYKSGLVNAALKASVGRNPVIELHMDAADGDGPAKGSHVAIRAGFSPDAWDTALADFLAGYFPGRADKITQRSDLANLNRAATYGINYRLAEVGMIDDKTDRDKFNANVPAVAAGILAAFGIGGTASVGQAPQVPQAPATQEKEEESVYKFRTVKKGAKGDHVRLFQAAYNERFGGSLAVDGSAGPATHAAIGDAQRRLGIAQDYSCGPDTWAHLLGA